MIDFIYKLHELIPSGQVESPLTIKQIAASTETRFTNVLQFLSEGLDREVEVSTELSKEDIQAALAALKIKMKSQIEERERSLARRRKAALKAYDGLIQRLSKLYVAREWYKSFRSLSYFAGVYEDDLDNSPFIHLCGEIVWTGVKSKKANLQELGFWLTKGVRRSFMQNTSNGLEEAIDLIDCYSDFFISQKGSGGEQTLENLLDLIKCHASGLGLLDHYNQLVQPIKDKLSA